MNKMYLLSHVSDEDVVSVLFRSKANAVSHVERMYPDYKKKAENRSEDIEYWHKNSGGEGIVIEKLKVED